MKNLFISTAFIGFLSLGSSHGSDPETNDRSWIPSHIKEEQKDTLYSLIKEEKSMRTKKNPGNENLDFGISFAGINLAQELCLIKINKIYEESGTRPKTADLGAGHGYMTWKMLVAGADVFAVEPQDPTREELMKNAKKANPFLKEGEKLNTISRCSKTSALSFDTCPAYVQKENYYDITWSGNLIHLFTPKEATGYVHNLYKITKPGGYAFATVHTACPGKEMLEFFLKRKEEGKEFPGFFMANHTTHLRQYVDVDWEIMRTINSNRPPFITGIDFSPVDIGDSEEALLSPTITTPGFYGGGEDQKQYREQLTRDETGSFYFPYDNFTHSTKHFFDKDSFRFLFEAAGFLVEDVFYMNLASNTRFEEELSLDMFSSSRRMSIFIGIQARKPY